jgi:hypothetical protein
VRLQPLTALPQPAKLRRYRMGISIIDGSAQNKRKVKALYLDAKRVWVLVSKCSRVSRSSSAAYARMCDSSWYVQALWAAEWPQALPKNVVWNLNPIALALRHKALRFSFFCVSPSCWAARRTFGCCRWPRQGGSVYRLCNNAPGCWWALLRYRGGQWCPPAATRQWPDGV